MQNIQNNLRKNENESEFSKIIVIKQMKLKKFFIKEHMNKSNKMIYRISRQKNMIFFKEKLNNENKRKENYLVHRLGDSVL